MTKNFAAVQSGSLALWDFSTFSGTTFVGELQTAPFYPVTILFALFSEVGNPLFVNLWIVFHFLTAAVLMHIFLKSLGIRPIGCILGSLIFAFAGPVAARATGQPNLHASLVYLPGVLFAAHRALLARRVPAIIKWTFASGLILGLTVLAGHTHGSIQSALALVIFLTSLTVRRPRPEVLRALSITAGAGLVSLLLSAVQLVPTWEYLRMAYKWYGTSYTVFPHLVPFSEYIKNTLVLSDFWSLLNPRHATAQIDSTTLHITITAAILVLLAGLKWRSRVFLFGTILLGISLLIASGGDSFLGRFFYTTPILNLIRIPTRSLHLYSLAAALLAALGFDGIQSRAKRKLLAQAVAFLVCTTTVLELLFFTSLLTAPSSSSVAPGNYFLQAPFLKTLIEKTEEEKGLFRFRATPKETVAPNLGNVFPVFSSEGHRATMYIPYADYLNQTADPVSRRLDHLSVRYLVTERPVDGLPLLEKDGDGNYLYERPSALPVFWLLQKEEQPVVLPIAQVQWSVNSVDLVLAQPVQGRLIFSQPFYPGWKAYVDGEERALSHYDIFNSLELSVENRRIRFSYLPGYLVALGLLSSLLLAGFLSLVLYERFRPNRF